MTNTSRKILDDIRRLIVDNQLSFLVGAGFSKNISPKFPLWRDLFGDAVWELYGNQREEDTPERRAGLVEEILRKTSLLDIASKIVEDAGFHEAIDEYIEKHTPYLVSTKQGPVLMLGNEVCDASPSFECHKLLKQLDIHNVYTFNYDNALEFCLGDKSQTLKMLSGLEKEVAQLEGERDKIEALIFRQSNGSDQPVSNQTNSISVMGDETERQNQQELFEEAIRERGRMTMEIWDRKRKIEDLKKELDNAYLIVKQSSDIALTSAGHNLYKIHGDLRIGNDGKYGFDGDAHSQYIITRDDYETYQNKHSAFVNLMRIDLLRNSFCIIGLSGSDANFLSWIRWVKDVLDKADGADEPRQSFFIYSSDSSLSAGMMQMLKNHFITPVILKDIFPDAANDQQRIKAFLEAVQPHKYISYSQMSRLWEKVKRKSYNAFESNLGEAELDELCGMSASMIFHKCSSRVHYTASDVVSGMMYKPLSRDSNLSHQKLFAAALRCSLIPLLEGNRTDMAFMSQSDCPYVKDTYDYAKTRSILLTDPGSSALDKRSVDAYSKILSRLFLFDFPGKEECKFQCKSGLDYVRRYALSVFLFNEEEERVTNIDRYFSTPQELVLAAGVVNSQGGYSNWIPSELVRKYQSKYSLFTLEEYILSYLNNTRIDVGPYGDVTDRVRLGSWNSGELNAAVLLNSFAELGIVSMNNNLITDNQWIEIVGHAKSLFPFPLTFYTVSGNFKDGTIKKVAQELIYDNYAYKLAPQLLDALISALESESTPLSLVPGIAIFAKELLVAVPPRIWKKRFIRYAECFFSRSRPQTPKSEMELFRFVSSGVSYLNDKDFKLDVLRYVLGNDTESVFDDNLLNSLAIAASDGLSVEDFKPLADLLVDYAGKEGHSDAFSYILMNLSRYLSKQDFLRINDIIVEQVQNDGNLADAYAFRVRDIPELSAAFRQSLIQKKNIWNTQVFSNTLSSSDAIVKIGRIDAILHFNQNQVETIYEDMKETLGQMIDIFARQGKKARDQRLFSWEDHLREAVMDMRLFFHRHSKALSVREDVGIVSDMLEEVFRSCLYGKSILSTIADDKIYIAIRAMMNQADIYGIEGLEPEYNALISTLLLRKSNYLNTCFRHLSWAVGHYRKFFSITSFRNMLVSVLDCYAEYFDGHRQWDIEGCEKEVAEKSLMGIYRVLRMSGISHKFWDSYKKKYRLPKIS